MQKSGVASGSGQRLWKQPLRAAPSPRAAERQPLVKRRNSAPQGVAPTRPQPTVRSRHPPSHLCSPTLPCTAPHNTGDTHKATGLHKALQPGCTHGYTPQRCRLAELGEREEVAGIAACSGPVNCGIAGRPAHDFLRATTSTPQSSVRPDPAVAQGWQRTQKKNARRVNVLGTSWGLLLVGCGEAAREGRRGGG